MKKNLEKKKLIAIGQEKNKSIKGKVESREMNCMQLTRPVTALKQDTLSLPQAIS